MRSASVWCYVFIICKFYFNFPTINREFIYSSITFVKYLEKQPPEVFCRKGVLRNFAKFTGKHPCQSLFFNLGLNH